MSGKEEPLLIQPKEDRRDVTAKYFGDALPHDIIRHLMLDYNRYFEADVLMRAIEDLGGIKSRFRVLDFGCAVGDYLFYILALARAQKLPKDTTLSLMGLDYCYLLDFAKYRFVESGLCTGQESCKFFTVDFFLRHEKKEQFFTGLDLLIFSEVLEHLDNPLELVRQVLTPELKPKFIFTSSYPFKHREDYDQPGHTMEAFHMQEKVVAALRRHYRDRTLGYGEMRLWELIA